MRILDGGPDPDLFFARLAAAPSRVLLLDYDGTLAPFREARDEAVPYPGVQERIEAIRADGGTRVVVISGRTLADLRRLLGLDPAPELWGTHGWERLHADGRLDSAPPTPEQRGVLDQAVRAAASIAPPERIETKPASVALHTRGLDAADAERLLERARSAWDSPLRTGLLEAHPFDGGLEARLRGRDKGTAVREVLATEPEGATAAYLGDDRTDEDAFRALGPGSLGVLVRDEVRETSAQLWLRPPEEMFAFLDRWREAAAPAPNGASGREKGLT